MLAHVRIPVPILAVINDMCWPCSSLERESVSNRSSPPRRVDARVRGRRGKVQVLAGRDLDEVPRQRPAAPTGVSEHDQAEKGGGGVPAEGQWDPAKTPASASRQLGSSRSAPGSRLPVSGQARGRSSSLAGAKTPEI